MIQIRPSPTADTRTCDWSKVTKETLLESSKQHIRDVRDGLAFFADRLTRAGMRHDHDKIIAIEHFHADFQTGFKQTGWWDNHRKVNRHHLTAEDGIPADVNLIDVLDFIVDCTMAGMARSGSVRPLEIAPEVLRRAFENTAALLAANVEVVRDAPAPPVDLGEKPPCCLVFETEAGDTALCSKPAGHDGDCFGAIIEPPCGTERRVELVAAGTCDGRCGDCAEAPRG